MVVGGLTDPRKQNYMRKVKQFGRCISLRMAMSARPRSHRYRPVSFCVLTEFKFIHAQCHARNTSWLARTPVRQSLCNWKPIDGGAVSYGPTTPPYNTGGRRQMESWKAKSINSTIRHSVLIENFSGSVANCKYAHVSTYLK